MECATIAVVALPEAADTAAPPGDAETVSIGESRLPPAAALIVFIALNIALRLWLPGQGLVRIPWVVPAIEAFLLVVLLTAIPAVSPGGLTGFAAFRSLSSASSFSPRCGRRPSSSTT